MRIVTPVRSMVPLAALSKLAGKPIDPDKLGVWVLETAVRFQPDGAGSPIIDIGPGALTDLASAPWLFRWFIEPEDWPWLNAAVIHDHAYAGLAVTRREADRWWREAVEADGASRLQAWGTWAALRVGGWLAWRKNRANLERLGERWRYLT